MTLILSGQQLGLFLGCIIALVLLGFALGACGRYGQGYERGWADAVRPRPCRRCRAIELADTQAAAAIDLDMLEAALEIVERQQAQRWAADPVLRGRLLELEVSHMAEAAEERIGRLRLRPPRNPAVRRSAGALGESRRNSIIRKQQEEYTPMDQQDQAATRPDIIRDEREWIGTFGHGHFLFAGNSYMGYNNSAEGIPLRNRFVRIKGDYASARLEMVRMFGTRWCDLYPNEESAGVRQHGLFELVLECPGGPS